MRAEMHYFTDSICSHCWGLEPQMAKLRFEYGPYLDVHLHTGAIVESWESFPGDKRNGIFTPTDTVPHWREYGEKSGMPIDGRVMLEDPVTSSYPPSQVFHYLKDHHPAQAETFLRKSREAVFLHNQTISRSEVLKGLLDDLGLDGDAIIREALTKTYAEKVKNDRALMFEMGAFVTPAVIFRTGKGKLIRKVGDHPYRAYVRALEKALNADELVKEEPPALREWLINQGTLFAKEIEVVYDLEPSEVHAFLLSQLKPEDYKLHHIQNTFYLTVNN